MNFEQLQEELEYCRERATTIQEALWRLRMLEDKEYKKKYLQAECHLEDYLEEEDEPEAPLYFIELQECETCEEIDEYMKDFGWGCDDYAVAVVLPLSLDHLWYLARHHLAERYDGRKFKSFLKCLNQCESLESIAGWMLSLNIKKQFWQKIHQRIMDLY